MTLAELLTKEIAALGEKAIKSEAADDAKKFVEAQLQLLDFYAKNVSTEIVDSQAVASFKTR